MARRRTFYVPVMIAAAVAVACVVALSAVSQKKAEATFPGKNGRIAYSGYDGNDYEIYTIKAGGGDKVQVTKNNRDDRGPSYSPSGKKIAYMARDESESGISTMKVGGGDKTNLSDNDTDSYDDYAPEYSPDGKKIVFMTYDDGPTWLSTINVDGSNETEITERVTADNGADAFESPSWGSRP
jgi:Tol biopolymer transport system component